MRWLVAGTLSILVGAFVYGQDSEPVARVTWRGIMTDITMGPVCQSQQVETFTFEGEESPREGTVWLSRNVTWDFERSCAEEIIVLADDDNDVTTPSRRVHRPWTATCKNQGEVDLNTWDGQLSQGVCEENPRLGYVTTQGLPTRWAGPKPESDMRDGCSYNSRRRQIDHRGNVNVVTESITVSRDQSAAVLEVDREAYEKFVPEPGKTLTFTALSSRPAVFRFELVQSGTSRFPGYATNAYIDDLFFVQHPEIKDLRETYLDDDPDLIFFHAHFPETEWLQTGFTVVETRQSQSSAVVTVTAMDYGAVGTLRAYVKSEDCGGNWQPVPVRLGNESNDSLGIPIDADGNLMADALEAYHFLDAGTDDDADPVGNGMVGDGLTAFEEYRGFMIRGAECGESAEALQEVGVSPPEVPGSSQQHVRTPPHHKNIFIYADDPRLALLVPQFAWSSGLSALAICESGYGSNDFRVVNFTLQESWIGQTWMGHTVTLPQPQHGIWLKRVDETSVPGLDGLAVAVEPDAIGPPALTTAVEIAKPLFNAGCRYACGPGATDLDHTVRHELGHAVGVPHHGDDVVDWRVESGVLDVNPWLSPRQRAGGPPDFTQMVESTEIPEALLIEPGPSCTESDDNAAYADEANDRFIGCLAANIVRRGQQHSGDMLCPMRIPSGDRYEAPGTNVRYLWSGTVDHPTTWYGITVSTSHRPVKVDAWGGKVLRYLNQYDEKSMPLGRFCSDTAGTGINAGALNHAGDNGRQRSCSEYIVVNDSVLAETQ